MYEHHDVNDENLGIRAREVKKGHAAQRAMERIRHGLGDRWSELGPRETEDLGWILGEMWAVAEEDAWDALRFGSLSLGDVIAILDLGTELKRHSRGAIEVLHEALAVVREVPDEPSAAEIPEE